MAPQVISPRAIWLGSRRIDALGIHAQLFERLRGLRRVELAITRQPRERGRDDGFGIHFEVPSQILAIFAATEAVVPSVTMRPGSQGATWSGTTFIWSVAATIGPCAPPSAETT